MKLKMGRHKTNTISPGMALIIFIIGAIFFGVKWDTELILLVIVWGIIAIVYHFLQNRS